MKLIILKNNLIEGLSYIDSTVGDGDKLPILKNVKIEAFENNNKVSFVSTNLESATTYETSAKVINEGTAIIPFSTIKKLVKELKSDKIKLIKKNKELNIKADNYEAVINCDKEEDFPVIPSVENRENFVNIQSQVFVSSLQQATKAARHSEIRPEINGIYLNYKKKEGFVMVSTDSFRLFEGLIDNKKFDTDLDSFKVTIPLQTVDSLIKNIKNEDKVDIFIDSTQVSFETDNLSVVSRLVDGDFPDYKSVIPKESKRKLIIKRKELINAIKVSRTFSGKANDISFEITDKGKVLEIKSSNNTLGKNTYRVPIKTQGEKNNLSITFNWRYVLDGLNIFDGDEIEIGITEPEKPVVFKSKKKQQKTIYVVMPIRA